MRHYVIHVFLCGAIAGLAAWTTAWAQSPAPDRIAGPLAGSPSVWLVGNRRPMFQPANDLGPVDGSFTVENLAITFNLTASQQADLSALLGQQQDPASASYHQWLTPEEFADRFGLSPADIQQVVVWLQSQGFKDIRSARSRMWVAFRGTAEQVRTAFQTEIHNFSLEGKTYYAGASEPAVPAALAGAVLGIRGLDNYRLKPRARVRHVAAEARPHFTSSISGNTFVAPGDFAVIYDVQSLYDAGIDGTGQTIAVMGQTDLYGSGSDITDFRTAAGLSTAKLTQKLDSHSSDPGLSSGDIEEASLDVEWSGAVAENATIIYYYSTDVINYSLYDAIDADLAPVISISYGACEAQWGTADLNTLLQMAEQANSQGQTIVAAAGDSGAADCDSSTSSSIVTTAQYGLAVDAPASVPNVTGMGGSEFAEGSGSYWTPATSSTGDIITSALSSIPETAWNDTSTSNGLLAGGGGKSSCLNATGTFPNVTCSGGFPKPAWQTAAGVPDDNARDVPDLSLNASPVHDPLLICSQGSCLKGTFRDSNQDLTVVGGTSAAAPTFAGIVALINQRMNTPKGQGNVNPTLYSMYATNPAAFHDITTGSNMVPCEAGSPDCPASGEMGYNAGVGYDQATGLGSVDAFNLVQAWGSAGTGNLPAPTLTAPANGATGVSVTPSFTWTSVSGSAGYRIMIASSPADLPTHPATSTCSACTIVDTSTTNSYQPSSSLAAGVYYWQVQALEPASSSGVAAWSYALVFNTEVPDFSLSVSPGTVSLSSGSNATTTITLTPINNFTGTPAFTCAPANTLSGVTCSVGTMSGNDEATVTITASSTARLYPPAPRNGPLTGWRAFVWAASCLLLTALSGLFGRTRAPLGWRYVTLGAVLAALLLASLSCGGGSGGGGGGSSPPSESGSVTITGTSGSLSHTAQFTATVN